jgi:hypothetical protein
MVEKSRKIPVCDAKSGKYRGFLWERLSAAKRETMIVKDWTTSSASASPPL